MTKHRSPRPNPKDLEHFGPGLKFKLGLQLFGAKKNLMFKSSRILAPKDIFECPPSLTVVPRERF
jgi:hypothetical protein